MKAAQGFGGQKQSLRNNLIRGFTIDRCNKKLNFFQREKIRKNFCFIIFIRLNNKINRKFQILKKSKNFLQLVLY